MRKSKLIGCIALLVVSALWAQDNKPFVVLPSGEAQAVNRLCSRTGPSVDEGWVPEEREIKALEARLGDVKLERRGVIPSPFGFYRQYIGIVAGGRRLIYVNAFPADSNLIKNWKTRLVSVCDGGSAFWGVQYDPAADKVFDLETNGVG